MSLWSILYLVALVALVPVASVRSLRAVEGLKLTTSDLYTNTAVSLWIMAALCYLVVRLDGQRLPDVLVRLPEGPSPIARSILWAAGMTAGGLAIFAAGWVLARGIGLPRQRGLLSRLRPATRREALLLALLVAPSAGFCEELIYRGFLVARLDSLSVTGTPAALLSGAVFGLAHLYQGAAGAARAASIGIVLAVPAVAAGSILASIAAHTLIDILGILWLWPALERAWPEAPRPTEP